MGEKEAARTAPGYITEPDIDLDAEEQAAGGGGGEFSAERATNLNSSKSNVNREMGPGNEDDDPAGVLNASNADIKR
ncbi:MAG: hypothetical protein HUU14_03935 [Dehalococcoidia bacterium]|nr:hypothetical protein [Dehalococcoidia bacterium]NUQ55019.1 hypothetical protein [Dehalococcoidia bacterium]